MYPLKFRAAILEKNNTPLTIKEVKFIGPLLAGQILVKVRYSGICGKQMEEISGAGGFDPYLPHLLGHEGFGEVVDIGPGVKKVQIGQDVVMHWRKGSGIQSDSPSYVCAESGEKINAGWVTTFNEYAVVSENRLTQCDGGIDSSLLCLFGCAVTTGVGVVLNQASLLPSDDVIIFGGGGIGLCSLQAAKLMRTRSLVMADISNEALKFSEQFNPTHTLNPQESCFIQNAMKITEGRGFNRVFLTTGNPNAIELGFKVASTPAEIYLIGVPPKDAVVQLNAFEIMHKKNIQGSMGGESYPDRDIPAYIRLQRDGHLHIEKLVGQIYPFKKVNEAIEHMKSSRPGRVILEMN